MAKTPTTAPGNPAPPVVAPPADQVSGAGTQPPVDPPAAPPAKPAKGNVATEPRMITVKILSPVHHDGEAIEVGAELTLPEEQAKALVLAGAAGQPDE